MFKLNNQEINFSFGNSKPKIMLNNIQVYPSGERLPSGTYLIPINVGEYGYKHSTGYEKHVPQSWYNEITLPDSSVESGYFIYLPNSAPLINNHMHSEYTWWNPPIFCSIGDYAYDKLGRKLDNVVINSLDDVQGTIDQIIFTWGDYELNNCMFLSSDINNETHFAYIQL